MRQDSLSELPCVQSR